MWEKRSGQICPEIHYKDTNQGIVITSCYGIEGQIILPDEIHGEPIVGIAAYAFAENREEEEGVSVWEHEDASLVGKRNRICGTSVTEIWLPAQVREIGRYAFYRCRNLKRLILSDSLLDLGGGALTGCHLEEVEIHFFHGERCCLKSIVDEMRYAIHTKLYYENGMAQVLFPEHYEEAVENTPARILVTHHHGAGGYYRQCFYDRKLDYKKYDELLYHTVAEEQPDVAAELVLNRVRYPYQLSEEAQDAYDAYLREHVDVAADVLITAEDIEGLHFLSLGNYWTPEALEYAVKKATEEKKTEVLSFLMDEKHRCFPKKKKTFEL